MIETLRKQTVSRKLITHVLGATREGMLQPKIALSLIETILPGCERVASAKDISFKMHEDLDYLSATLGDSKQIESIRDRYMLGSEKQPGPHIYNELAQACRVRPPKLDLTILLRLARELKRMVLNGHNPGAVLDAEYSDWLLKSGPHTLCLSIDHDIDPPGRRQVQERQIDEPPYKLMYGGVRYLSTNLLNLDLSEVNMLLKKSYLNISAADEQDDLVLVYNRSYDDVPRNRNISGYEIEEINVSLIKSRAAILEAKGDYASAISLELSKLDDKPTTSLELPCLIENLAHLIRQLKDKAEALELSLYPDYYHSIKDPDKLKREFKYHILVNYLDAYPLVRRALKMGNVLLAEQILEVIA